MRRGVSAKIAAAALAALVVVAAAAFLATRGGGAGPGGEEAFGVIRIGFTYSATGPFAPIGEEYRKGALAWWKYVNESGGIRVGDRVYQVKLIMLDDESDPDKVREKYRSIVEEGYADFLLSPAVAALTLPAVEYAEQMQKIILVTTPDDSFFRWGYQYAYQVASPASEFAYPALDLINTVDPDFTTIAIVYIDSPLARVMAQGIKQWAGLNGKTIVFEYYYEPGTTEFEAIARQVAQAAPDVVFAGGGVEETARLVEALYEAGVPAKAIVLFQGQVAPVEERLGDAALGLMDLVEWYPRAAYSPFTASQLGLKWYGPTVTDFDALYQRMFGELPSAEAARAFAALLVLQYAIETAGSYDTPAVKRVLDNTSIMIFYGPIGFDPNPETHGRQILHTPLVAQWQRDPATGDLTIKIVAPPAFANAEPIYPLPWSQP